MVLADTRRLADCFPSIDYFETRNLPFLVGVNCFDNEQKFSPAAVRTALDLDDEVPVVLCDARDRASGKELLIELVEYVIKRNSARRD